MSHSNRRTKKDVQEAYRRGFEAGFNVRPHPFVMILRSIWRKHELRKLKKAWKEEVNRVRGTPWGDISSHSIGFVKNFREDENGLHAEIELDGPNV